MKEWIRTVRKRFQSPRSKERSSWWLPLAGTVLVVYIILGSSAFLFFEREPHEEHIREYFLKLSRDRRLFAKSIMKQIFNDTKSLLIIIDREQTRRVEEHLVKALYRYEEILSIKRPDERAWNIWNSLNYALSLLTTIGHGEQAPGTTNGQTFALCYALLGVPFFFGTMAAFVYNFFVPAFQKAIGSFNRRIICVQIVAILLVFWIMCAAIILWYFVFKQEMKDTFWAPFHTAVFSSLTIQTRYYNQLETLPTLFMLFSAVVTVSFGLLLVFLVVGAGQDYNKGKRTGKVDDSGSDQPKLSMVVDETGESKLAK